MTAQKPANTTQEVVVVVESYNGFGTYGVKLELVRPSDGALVFANIVQFDIATQALTYKGVPVPVGLPNQAGLLDADVSMWRVVNRDGGQYVGETVMPKKRFPSVLEIVGGWTATIWKEQLVDPVYMYAISTIPKAVPPEYQNYGIYGSARFNYGIRIDDSTQGSVVLGSGGVIGYLGGVEAFRHGTDIGNHFNQGGAVIFGVPSDVSYGARELRVEWWFNSVLFQVTRQYVNIV